MRPTWVPPSRTCPSVTLKDFNSPVALAEMVTSVASNVPVASNAFSFLPQALITSSATLAMIVIFFIVMLINCSSNISGHTSA